MKLLVTGANGFVGSAIVREARERGHDVRTFTRADGDICDAGAAKRVAAGVDVVIHAAGSAHLFKLTPETEKEQRRVNVDGTRTFAAAARDAHFVLVSSVSVHAGGTTTYAQSKMDGERVASEVAQRLTIVRLATVYGPGDPGNVARLIRTYKKLPVRIGDGSNRKTLIYIDDVAAGVLAAATSDAQAQRDAYDLAAPPVTMREVLDAIDLALGRKLRVTIPAAPLRILRPQLLRKFTSDEVFDPAPFAQRYGFTARTPLVDGITREVAWLRGAR